MLRSIAAEALAFLAGVLLSLAFVANIPNLLIGRPLRHIADWIIDRSEAVDPRLFRARPKWARQIK